MAIPARLYKYRAFNARTIELLVDDKVHFSDPSKFNDPLDTRPTLVADLDPAELEAILNTLTAQRISAEMQAAAKRIKYSGPGTVDHLEQRTRREVSSMLRNIAYMATDDTGWEGRVANHHAAILRSHIEVALLRQYNKGILSLAERHDCPLMWSHYGDQHHGVCLGYSVPEAAAKDIRQVDYDGGRNINASSVKAMLDGDEHARADVDAGVLLRKAPDWKYEKEWRMLGPRGQTDSPLELEEVIFGARCLPAVKHTVHRALHGRDREVSFFQMRESAGEFGLHRVELDDQDMNSQPRRALTLVEAFTAIDE